MGLYVPYAEKRDTGALFRPGPIIDSSLVLFAPLWHPDLSYSPFTTKDATKHSCTVTGATWGPQGRTFVAANNDYITVASNVTKGLTGLTLEAWVKPTDLSTTYGLFGDYTDATDVSMLVQIFDVPATGTWRFVMYLKPDDSNWIAFNSLITTRLYGVWHHIICTWDLSNLRNYIGGALDPTTPACSGTKLELTVTANTCIGAYKPAAGQGNIDGIIGEVRIYNRPLSAGEVMRNFLSTKWRYA